MIRLQLPFPPTVNTLFRNVRGKGRVRTEKYLNWIDAADKLTLAGRQQWEPIKGPVRIKIMIGNPKPNRRRDCSNYIKALEDWLVSREYIEADDHSIVKGISIEWAEIEGAVVEVHAV